jgi:hypothetical protein
MGGLSVDVFNPPYLIILIFCVPLELDPRSLILEIVLVLPTHDSGTRMPKKLQQNYTFR